MTLGHKTSVPGSQAGQGSAGGGAEMTPPSVRSYAACCGWAWRPWLVTDLKINICVLFARCCSWFCLRTVSVSRRMTGLRLFILTQPGEDTVTGPWHVFSAHGVAEAPCVVSPFLALGTVPLWPCQGNDEGIPWRLITFLLWMGSCLQPHGEGLPRGQPREDGGEGISSLRPGGQGAPALRGECSLPTGGEGYQKVNMVCLRLSLFKIHFAFPQVVLVFTGRPQGRLLCALRGSFPVASSAHLSFLP